MKSVVITRPAAQATALAERLAAAGFEPLIFPAIAIAPVTDPAPLQLALSRLSRYRLVVFVSPNAIDLALSGLAGPWPESLAIGVMGPGSIEALMRHGLTMSTHRIISPALQSTEESDLRFDSESLLQQLDVTGLQGGPVLIVKGNGGRPWLAQRLTELGVAVDQVESYQRSRHHPDAQQQAALQALIARQAAVTWIVTSSESIAYLFESLQELGGSAATDWLRNGRWLVPHQRIAENATAAGVGRLLLSGPGDVNIVQALNRG